MTLISRVMVAIGFAEILVGLALLIVKNDAAQGYALLGIGAGTVSATPWLSRNRRGSATRDL